MCGIVGSLYSDNYKIGIESIILSMITEIKHRGPDDSGIWIDGEKNVALGQARLSIIDLSAAGHQPMISASGRYVISFNGEIYNYKEIKCELSIEQSRLRGTSDTEIILESIDKLGVYETIKKLNGMFAIAVWDKKERLLYLTRDRVGKKPLYYGVFDNCLIFASEMKALTRFPSFKKEINQNSLKLFLHLSYIPGQESIFKDCYRVEPGTIEVFDSENLEKHIKFKYWSFSEFAVQKKSERLVNKSDDEWLSQLDVLLTDSIKKRMISDVPLGSFLSGGIDSTLITATMQKISSQPIKTFTIGFKEKQYNEAIIAKEIANSLGTDHTELYISCKDLVLMVPDLCKTFDEPFGDPSQLPTYMVSKLAKKDVTVALSGDGGDELFAGYNRYISGLTMWNRMKRYPYFLRLNLSRLINAFIPIFSNMYLNMDYFLHTNKVHRDIPEKLNKIRSILKSKSVEEMYYNLINNWNCDKDSISVDINMQNVFSVRCLPTNQFENSVHWMMAYDFLNYLPEDIMTKVDRTSMAVSLETRAPFLDYRIVEFAWSLPLVCKVREGKRKWALRKLLEKYIPLEKIDKPKTGFDIPIGEWLRKDLKDWANDILNTYLVHDSFLDKTEIQKAWQHHLAGTYGYTKSLWNVIMYLTWKQRWFDE